MSRNRIARGWLLAFALFGISGCHSRSTTPETPKEPFRGITLVTAAVDDPAILATLTAQRGEWVATRGAELSIRTDPIGPDALEGVDVVLFRGDRLGDLIDVGALAVLPETVVRPRAPSAPEEDQDEPSPEPVGADRLQFADVVPAFRDQVTKYGAERVALPYGASALVLVYQRVAFEREANRAAAGDVKLTLGPPQTWDQLDAMARFFQGRDWDGDGSSDHGIALALGPDAEGVGDAVFLARAASLGQHHDQYSFLFDADSMAPRIDSPPFVEALQGLAALNACGPPGLARFDAEAARRAFRRGDVALLIDRAECAARWSEGRAVGVAPLPGSGRVYDPARGLWEAASPPNQPSYLPFGGGWLVGVIRSTRDRRREAAIDFAQYLVSPETSNRVRADRSFPMLPVRVTQLGQGLPDPRSAPGVDSRLWSDAVGRTLLAARVVPGLRIPKADAYLEDLARGRVAAIEGEPAAQALKDVAQRWSARTRALGTARQLWHYRQSLNSLANAPEPPER